jgi:predicted ATPase/class 3 adenylate cyclase
MRSRVIVIGRDGQMRARLARLVVRGGHYAEVAESYADARRAGLERVALAVVCPDGLEREKDALEELRGSVGRVLIVASPGGARFSDAIDASDEAALLARMAEALAPLAEPTPRNSQLEFAGFRLDLAGHSLADPLGRAVELTPGEFGLLRVFAERPGRVLSRDQILQLTAGRDAEAFDRSIDMHITRLRRKIEPDPKRPSLIVTVAGSGYKFAPHVREVSTSAPEQATPAAPPPAAAPTASERRHVVALAAELVAQQGRRLPGDPEDLGALIAAFRRDVSAALIRHGGLIREWRGREILAYFGFPFAQEHAVEQALSAALALSARVMQGESATTHGAAARIGVAAGLVVADQSGDILGETPNEARRLSALAAPGQTLASTDVHRQAEKLFEFRKFPRDDDAELGEIWQAVALSAASRSEALFAFPKTRLAGRDEELSLLVNAWRRARSGDGRLVLLSGEAGIGKSRLLAALEDELAGEAHFGLRYFCSALNKDSALHPIIARFEQEAGFVRGEPAEARLAKLEARLAAAKLPSEDFALIADVLSVTLGNSYPRLALNPEQRKRKTFDALQRWLFDQAKTAPVLMLFEDAHWADASSLDLLDGVVSRLPDHAILVVVSYRPEFAAPWTDASAIALGRLNRRQSEQLAAQIRGARAFSTELQERILTQADGVPLFIEEVTRLVLEHDESDGERMIPTTLQQLLAARLDRLSGAKPVAQTAAIIGREFSYELLRVVTSLSETELEGALRQLVESGLIYQRGDPPRSRYTFKHALVQDAASHSLLKVNQGIEHRRVAEALEKHFADTVENQPELLAYHYSEAGLVEPAIKYWRKAGQRATKRATNVEAIDHLRRGLAMLALLPDRAAHAEEELTMLIALGPALMSTKTSAAPEIQQVYDRALRLARNLGKVAELFATIWGAWLIALTQGDQASARGCTAELFDIAREQKDAGYLLQAHHCAWPTEALAGNFRSAHEHVNSGVRLYDKDAHREHAVLYGGHDPAVCGHLTEAIVLQVSGQSDSSRACLEKGVALARELEHSPTLNHALWYAAEIYFLRRDPVAVATVVAEWLPSVSQFGSSVGVANATMMSGWAKVMAGDAAAGLAELREGLDRWRATGSKPWGSIRLGRAAAAFIEAGDDEQGATLLAEAFQVMEDNGERWYEAELLRLQGVVLFGRAPERTTEAQWRFERAIEVARSQGALLFELRAAAALCRLPCAREQSDARAARLAAICSSFTEGFDTPDLEEARSLLDQR